MQVTVPTDGVYGGYYAQSRRHGSPAPVRARGCGSSTSSATTAPSATSRAAPIPARFAALEATGKITDEPEEEPSAGRPDRKVAFPTQAQTDAAKKVLADNWGPMVADA